jgi:hypothetical protein
MYASITSAKNASHSANVLANSKEDKADCKYGNPGCSLYQLYLCVNFCKPYQAFSFLKLIFPGCAILNTSHANGALNLPKSIAQWSQSSVAYPADAPEERTSHLILNRILNRIRRTIETAQGIWKDRYSMNLSMRFGYL